MEDRSRHSVVLGGWIGRPVNSVKVELECLSSRKKNRSIVQDNQWRLAGQDLHRNYKP